MTDIQAIKKAAEAADRAEDEARERPSAINVVACFDARKALAELCTPATVLELCRLAEIGHCFVHDDPGEAKRAKMLRLTDEYAIAHGGPAMLEELQK